MKNTLIQSMIKRTVISIQLVVILLTSVLISQAQISQSLNPYNTLFESEVLNVGTSVLNQGIFLHNPYQSLIYNQNEVSESSIELTSGVNTEIRLSKYLLGARRTQGSWRNGKLTLNDYSLAGYNIDSASISSVTNGPWDMIKLNSVYNPPNFNIQTSWNLGIMQAVEYDGGLATSDQYDCLGCLTYTYQSYQFNGGSPLIKRVFDKDGHAHTAINDHSNPTIRGDSEKNGKNAIQKLVELKIVDYQNKSRIQSDFRLDDLKKMFPELVVSGSIDAKGKKEYFFNYEGLVPILTKAIQEQQEDIEAQNTRLLQMETQNKELRAEMNRFKSMTNGKLE